MLKILLFLPLIIVRSLWTILPMNFITRSIFKYTYKPSSNQDRTRSNEMRNAIRLAEYKSKQFVRGE